ncbi:FkbM family methyltransferase [Mesorhizobium sp. 2RAF45]|uniref:FkbM family methyltransferase n=1 Tax=Mesorhizobium sp. 2RAF45 TaxID=3233001 RepID=UPI003F9497CE
MRKLRHFGDRLREEPDKFRFVLSRALWATGLCRLITFSFPEGYRMRFYPSAISAGLWRDRNFRSEDVDFVAGYLRPGETFVDVGANVGQLSLVAARRVTSSGRTIAIEAHPRTCNFLRGNVRLNGFPIEIHNVAVGSECGELFFTNFRSDDMNFAYAASPRSGSALRVPVATLDSIICERPVDLLKVDVEGFECDLLQGAAQTLHNCRCLYIEDSEPNLRRAGSSRAELYDRLSERGFELFHVRGKQLERVSVQAAGPLTENLIAVRGSDLPDALARTGFCLA